MPKRQGATEHATLERFNTWKLYVPEGKKELFLRFLELADELEKSRSGAVMEAIERYYPKLEELKARQRSTKRSLV